MKRTTLAVLMLALALVALAAPMAYAQAPTPKVTINGLIDNVTSYARNVSQYDALLNRNDTQWYGRTRGRFDFIGEIGKAKGVLGIELDHTYGQTGSNDSSIGNTGGTASIANATAFGTDGGFDLNTDSRGIIEIKWLYVEFPVPLIPIPTTARLGAQPFGAASTFKLCVYTCSDFAGVNVTSQITPNVKFLATFVQVQESLTGVQTKRNFAGPLGIGGAGGGPSGASTQNRGDDMSIIVSAEVTPFKGLDIKPMFSWFYAQGTTDGNARQSRGGIVAGGSNNVGASAFNNPDGTVRGGINENRYTVGLDSRLRLGPFSFDPTVLYQFGNRGVFSQAGTGASVGANSANTVAGGLQQSGAVAGRRYYANLDAWLVDLREGFQLGPLLIEALQVYSTGNSYRNNQLGTVRSFQPLTTDTGYLADWGAQLTSLGLDYLSALNEAGGRIAYPGVTVGWDKYGRGQLGFKATYAITPALSVMAGVNGHWTAEGVDRNCQPVAGAGCIPVYNVNTVGTFGSKQHDRSHFLGTEFQSVVSWRFADGLVWDNGVGYMIMGPAMDAFTDSAAGPRNTKDAFIGTSRVRLTF